MMAAPSGPTHIPTDLLFFDDLAGGNGALSC